MNDRTIGEMIETLNVEDQIAETLMREPPRRQNGLAFLSRRANKDTAPHHIPATLPPTVDEFLATYKRVQEQTAKQCLETAAWLEQLASDLKDKAATINHQAQQIPDDMSNSVRFEQETRHHLTFISSLRK